MGLTDEQRAAVRAELEELERDLRGRIEQSTASSQPVDLDEPIGRLSRIDAIQAQHMALDGLSREQARLVRVRHALHLVNTPEFGNCASCKQPIGIDRLLFQPEVLLCVRCA